MSNSFITISSAFFRFVVDSVTGCPELYSSGSSRHTRWIKGCVPPSPRPPIVGPWFFCAPVLYLSTFPIFAGQSGLFRVITH